MRIYPWLGALMVMAGTSGAWADSPPPAPSAPPVSAANTTITNAPITVNGQRKRPTHEWLRAQSRHFTILSNRRRSDVDKLVMRLEAFHTALRLAMGLSAQETAPIAPTTLYFLSDERDLGKVAPGAPDDAIGLYTTCPEGVQGFGVDISYIGSGGQKLEEQPENEGLSYIFEAYARHFWYAHALQRSPLWFVEGLAHYFSSTRLDGETAVIGMAPAAMGSIALGQGLHAVDYADVLLGQKKDITAPKGALAVKAEFASRAWVLVHWILSSPDNQALFRDYAAALDEGEKPLVAFRRIYHLTPAQLDAQLWRYAAQLKAVKLTLANPPAEDTIFTYLGQGEGPALLLDAALTACPAPAQGRKLLDTATRIAAAQPRSMAAQAALLRAQVMFGDPMKALPALSQRAHDDAQDATARYLLGRSFLTLATTAPAASADRAEAMGAARQMMAAALAAAPTHAPSAFGFYQASVLAGSPDAKALAAIDAAYRLAPEVDAYSYNAALALAWQGKAEEARLLMRALAGEAEPTPWTEAARAWLTRPQAAPALADLQAALALHGARLKWTQASAMILKELDAAAGRATEVEDATTIDTAAPNMSAIDSP